MPKATSQHICQSCGFSSPKWHGRCPRCEQWDTLEETAIARPVAAAPRSASALSRGRRPALVHGVPLSVAPLQRKRGSR
jgi:DNA repair protein RadA/Sms